LLRSSQEIETATVQNASAVAFESWAGPDRARHAVPAETSCYRYWEGVWTDYGAELAHRVAEFITHPET